ncbi:MAG: hypothetical protein Q7U42_01255, partial [Parvibaculum sp.]|nr:hypothetical protein [Parvibaculum sp.]
MAGVFFATVFFAGVFFAVAIFAGAFLEAAFFGFVGDLVFGFAAPANIAEPADGVSSEPGTKAARRG